MDAFTRGIFVFNFYRREVVVNMVPEPLEGPFFLADHHEWSLLSVQLLRYLVQLQMDHYHYEIVVVVIHY